MMITLERLRAIRFNRHELSGSLGDIGTDFPLIASLILVAGLDATSVLVMFGVMQILTGLLYGIPMPVQPLKAMTVLVITQKLGADVLYGAGLAIGILMLFLTVTGLIDWLAKVVPKSVVRGVQFGLGLQLALLALQYTQAEGLAGYVLAGTAFGLTVVFLGSRRYPPALFIILLGVLYALTFKLDMGGLGQGVGFSFPRFHTPTFENILTGFLTLALPQLPLSLANSILATRQGVEDLFPDRPISVRKLGCTYALMNLLNPFFGGVPTCHGSGGLAGHYTFGARTGGSVIIYGTLYLLLGLFWSTGFREVVELFPKPVLGVILLFEGLALMRMIRDTFRSQDLTIGLLVGLVAVGLPYGYLIGLVVGTLLVSLLALKKLQGLPDS